MRTATRLVFDYQRENLPLGKNILEEEIPVLTSALRQRLGMSISDLDFSPTSLKRLEDVLVVYPQKVDFDKMSDDDIMQFVREIAAYVGKILVSHTRGKWEPLGTLWGTQVTFEGKIKITKEGRTRVVPSIAFSLGNIGSAAVDMMRLGKKPLLYRDYLSARKRFFKEDV